LDASVKSFSPEPENKLTKSGGIDKSCSEPIKGKERISKDFDESSYGDSERIRRFKHLISSQAEDETFKSCNLPMSNSHP